MKKNSSIKKNQFFDINKLPGKEGILLFPISMSRISNAQTAKNCWNYLKIFSPKKVIKPLIGLNFIYGDYLYLYSDKKASELKNVFFQKVLGHKNEFLKILGKHPFYIKKGASFTTWNQVCLENKDFNRYFWAIQKFYHKDKKFQKYVKQDAKHYGKKLDKNQLNFFLEESLLFYLLAKGQIKLHNEYILNHEKWILWCYPGKPLKSQIYILQKNFFKLKNSKNKYENSMYDLEEKKLYDAKNIDLETWNYE